MTNRIFISISFILFFVASINFISCSKPDPVTPPADPCAGKTIVVTGTTTPISVGSTNNGAINATATGSTGFTYSLNNGAFQASGTFSNLVAGSYSVVAKDANNCTGSQSFTVTATPCPTITITATTTPSSSTTTPNGSITATATGSTGITYSNNGGPFQSSGTFTALGVGTYNITAKDVNGCTVSAPFNVVAAGCPTITVTSTTTNTAGPTATNGSITATATGGTGTYTFSKDAGANFQSSNIFNNLAAGNYTIIAKDANGCLGSSATITVASNPCPTINFTQVVTGTDKCVATGTGSITVSATGSTGFMYQIGTNAYQTSNIFNNLAVGTFTINVRDLNGCIKTGTVPVAQAPAGPLFTSVKSIMTANCATAGCHAGASPQSGINFSDDCTIVSQKARIKARAVDANPSVMPPSGAISAADKQKIVDWINAGGQHTN